jgi:hypothetical protein
MQLPKHFVIFFAHVWGGGGGENTYANEPIIGLHLEAQNTISDCSSVDLFNVFFSACPPPPLFHRNLVVVYPSPPTPHKKGIAVVSSFTHLSITAGQTFNSLISPPGPYEQKFVFCYSSVAHSSLLVPGILLGSLPLF